MSEAPLPKSDKPTAASVSLLIRSLQTDSATRGVSPANYAHRSRVIRQQAALLPRARTPVRSEPLAGRDPAAHGIPTPSPDTCAARAPR